MCVISHTGLWKAIIIQVLKVDMAKFKEIMGISVFGCIKGTLDQVEPFCRYWSVYLCGTTQNDIPPAGLFYLLVHFYPYPHIGAVYLFVSETDVTFQKINNNRKSGQICKFGYK